MCVACTGEYVQDVSSIKQPHDLKYTYEKKMVLEYVRPLDFPNKLIPALV
jgi:hypothetical protein